MNFRRATVLTVVITLAVVFPAAAGVQHRVDASNFETLARPLGEGGRARVEKIPLIDDRPETLILESFDVLAPGAVIEVFDGDGKGTIVKPQPMKQFRGRVEGDPLSLVYLSVTRGKIDGMIVTRDRKFTVTSALRSGTPRASLVTSDVLVEEVTGPEEFEVGNGFECGVEGKTIFPARPAGPRLQTNGLPVTSNYTWPTTTATSMINLVVESDAALYTNFANDANAVQVYLRNLVGATATIYLRDLRADIRISYLGVRTTTDPWPVNPGTTATWDGVSGVMTSLNALLEYGDYWNLTPPTAVKKSAAVLISGQSQTAGIAWTDILCGPTGVLTPDYGAPYAGHRYGPYAYCGGVGRNVSERTVPDPNGLTNYGVPSNYWPLMQLSHELGHVVESVHTHCVALSPADKVTYSRDTVDNCYSGEGAGCFSGSPTLPSDGLDGKGTIMSYCHILAGSAGVRFIFGRNGEASHTIVDNMRTRLDALTPLGFSAITAPASVAPGGSGSASVTNTAGLTYDWTITNGTFSGGGTTAAGASVNFTGTTNPVTLRVVATNTDGCAVTDTKQVTVGGAAPLPPTNVMVYATTGSTVSLSWSGSNGATGYRVYRRSISEGGAYLLVANLGPPTSYIDNVGVSANTAYQYVVHAVNAGGESGDSNSDFIYTGVFTDPTLSSSVSVKAIHFTQLQDAVNALRALAGLTAFSFSAPPPGNSVTVKKAHVDELVVALNAARTPDRLGGGAISIGETLNVGSTTIKASHLTALRNGTL